MPKYKAKPGESLHKTSEPLITEIRSLTGSSYYARYVFAGEDSGSFTWATFEDARDDLTHYLSIKQWIHDKERGLVSGVCPFIG